MRRIIFFLLASVTRMRGSSRVTFPRYLVIMHARFLLIFLSSRFFLSVAVYVVCSCFFVVVYLSFASFVFNICSRARTRSGKRYIIYISISSRFISHSFHARQRDSSTRDIKFAINSFILILLFSAAAYLFVYLFIAQIGDRV